MLFYRIYVFCYYFYSFTFFTDFTNNFLSIQQTGSIDLEWRDFFITIAYLSEQVENSLLNLLFGKVLKPYGEILWGKADYPFKVYSFLFRLLLGNIWGIPVVLALGWFNESPLSLLFQSQLTLIGCEVVNWRNVRFSGSVVPMIKLVVCGNWKAA